jgi:pimeloyl-ACP methyl ester carboxylesterase
MPQTHYTPRPLPVGQDSVVRWAIDPVKRAVVFVHGFAGEALGTWDQFGTLLPLQAEAVGRDLFFYGYESVAQQAPISAAEFRDFLFALWDDPVNAFIKPTVRDARRADPMFRYDHITLVAHSLGAVVVREALVQAALEAPPPTWLHRLSLVLFAPAHSGAKATELGKELLGVLPAPIESALRAGVITVVPVLVDLEPGSVMLTKLAKDTGDLLEQGYNALRAKVVVVGSKDQVVHSVRFCADPGPRRVKGIGHIPVCKPNPSYREPLGFLLSHI